jgi:hypothetical protein
MEREGEWGQGASRWDWGRGEGEGRWERGGGLMSRLRGRFAGRGPRNYTRTDDRIIEDINEQLTRDPEIDATEIEVTCQNGEVILRGAVDSREEKRRAEDIAEDVWGVKAVNNQIRVQRWQERPGQAA